MTSEERVTYLRNEDRKARTHLAAVLDLPMPPGAEPPGWTHILDCVSATVFQLGEARKEIEALTPRWQEGLPPTRAWVWREQPDRPPRVVYTVPVDGGGVEFWTSDSTADWGTARWALPPAPADPRP